MSNTSDVSPILQALYEGRNDDAEALAAEATDLDPFEAAALGRTERLREHLDADPTVANAWSSDGFQALHLAAFFGHANAAALLLERGAEPGNLSRHEFIQVTPLHSAVAQEGSEDLRTVEVLLDRGAPVDARAEGGGTPLHSAAANGNAAVIELLLAHGADRNAAKDDGKTPVDVARESGHAGVLELDASDAQPS